MSTVLIIVIVICALAGALIGKPKGRAGLGLFLGAVLGVIGLLIIALMPPAKPGPKRPAHALPAPKEGGLIDRLDKMSLIGRGEGGEVTDASGRDLHAERNLP